MAKILFLSNGLDSVVLAVSEDLVGAAETFNFRDFAPEELRRRETPRWLANIGSVVVWDGQTEEGQTGEDGVAEPLFPAAGGTFRAPLRGETFGAWLVDRRSVVAAVDAVVSG